MDRERTPEKQLDGTYVLQTGAHSAKAHGQHSRRGLADAEDKQPRSRAQVTLFADEWLSSAQSRAERPDYPPVNPSHHSKHAAGHPMEAGIDAPEVPHTPAHAAVALARAVVSVSPLTPK